MKRIIMLAACFIISGCLFAQDSTHTRASITAGVEFNSVPIVDASATDSSGSSLSIAPYLKFQFHSGIGIKAQAYLLTSGAQPGYYLTALSPFYAVDNKKKQLDISYTHFFFNGNKSMYYSPITNEIYASVTFKTKTISPVAGVDLGFGKDTTNGANTSVSDVNIFLGATHTFDWDLGDEVSLGFSPKMVFNIGTDKYFSFLNSARFITHSKNFKKIVKTNVHGNGRGNHSTTTSSASFAVNNLEAAAAFSLSAGNFTIEPEASLFVPFGADGQGVYGYWQIGISYKFGK